MSKQPTIAFLVVLMSPGWGVSTVVHELCKRMSSFKIKPVVGCLHSEGKFGDLEIHHVPADPDAVNHFISKVNASAVIAQTSPYFEMLPTLPEQISRIVWEHGDPTPEFFPADEKARREIIENKRRRVYPAVDAVIASSEFLRADIAWPEARIVNLAGDHMPAIEAKPRESFVAGRPLRVGTLMRLGEGEAFYKGNQIFCQIQQLARQSGLAAQFEVMGRGNPEQALPFENVGIRAHLNASDDERTRYLRNLDVFISCSQWEGFNLPLVEAQQVGTVGLAFDAGAHPEVTPFLVSSTAEVLSMLQAYSEMPDLLHQHSLSCYDFVRQRFSWDRAASEFVDVVRAVAAENYSVAGNENQASLVQRV